MDDPSDDVRSVRGGLSSATEAFLRTRYLLDNRQPFIGRVTSPVERTAPVMITVTPQQIEGDLSPTVNSVSITDIDPEIQIPVALLRYGVQPNDLVKCKQYEDRLVTYGSPQPCNQYCVRVRRLIDLSPVVGADVVAKRSGVTIGSGKTDENGVFCLSGQYFQLFLGVAFYVTYTHTDGSTCTETCGAASGAKCEVSQCELYLCAGTADFQVRDLETGGIVSNATVIPVGHKCHGPEGNLVNSSGIYHLFCCDMRTYDNTGPPTYPTSNPWAVSAPDTLGNCGNYPWNCTDEGIIPVTVFNYTRDYVLTGCCDDFLCTSYGPGPEYRGVTPKKMTTIWRSNDLVLAPPFPPASPRFGSFDGVPIEITYQGQDAAGFHIWMSECLGPSGAFTWCALTPGFPPCEQHPMQSTRVILRIGPLLVYNCGAFISFINYFDGGCVPCPRHGGGGGCGCPECPDAPFYFEGAMTGDIEWGSGITVPCSPVHVIGGGGAPPYGWAVEIIGT